jgi:outer membrane protein OmpA-like peptidoglycan-associated protein
MQVRMDLTPEMIVYINQVVEEPKPLPNIYFDFDKWNIRNDAGIQLDNIFQAMLDNPDMIMQIGAHADSRGSQAYNVGLTEKRAMSVVNYLTNRGISRNRIVALWYGKSQPVNDCTKCTPEQHQLNRRAEFKQQAATWSVK